VKDDHGKVLNLDFWVSLRLLVMQTCSTLSAWHVVHGYLYVSANYVRNGKPTIKGNLQDTPCMF
jgi:hypothetical protein